LSQPTFTSDCAILGVDKDHTMDGLKAAWRRKALETHPDRVGGDGEGFKQARAAFERLVQFYKHRHTPQPAPVIFNWVFEGVTSATSSTTWTQTGGF
jgi:hypothetical protein